MFRGFSCIFLCSSFRGGGGGGGGGGGLSRAFVECHLSKELGTPAVASLSTRFRQFPNLFVRMPIQRQDMVMHDMRGYSNARV